MEGFPVKLWGLDPLFWTHVKLFAVEVLKLPHYPGFQGVYAISNHPIVRAEVAGYVVKVDKREKLTVYGVDDGTATISCCHWVDQGDKPHNTQEANLGDLVTVLGKITTFRGERQITIKKICTEKDPNAEVLYWLEVLNSKEVYNRPFKVPEMQKPKATKSKHWLKTPLDVEVDSLEEAFMTEITDYLELTNSLSFSSDTLWAVSKLKEKALMISKKCDQRLTSEEESGDKRPQTKCAKRMFGGKIISQSDYGYVWGFLAPACLAGARIVQYTISILGVQILHDEKLSWMFQFNGLESQIKRRKEKDSYDEARRIICRTLGKLEKEGIVFCTDIFKGSYEFISVKKDLSLRVLDVIRNISKNQGESSCGISKGAIMAKLRSLEKYKNVRVGKVVAALSHLMEFGDIYETRPSYYRMV